MRFLSRANDGVETCHPWSMSTTQQVDLAFNVFFMIYFFIRVSRWLSDHIHEVGLSRDKLQPNLKVDLLSNHFRVVVLSRDKLQPNLKVDLLSNIFVWLCCHVPNFNLIVK